MAIHSIKYCRLESAASSVAFFWGDRFVPHHKLSFNRHGELIMGSWVYLERVIARNFMVVSDFVKVFSDFGEIAKRT